MADKENLEKHLQELNEFVLKNIDNYDFLSKDDMFLEKGLMTSMLKNMEKVGVCHGEYNLAIFNNSDLVKSSTLSIRMRNAGNRIFTRQFHNESVHWNAFAYYTQSIAAAPSESEELVLGYSNRAALLVHMKKYEACLEDCKRATSIAKSEQLKVKLLFRKTEALIGLKDCVKAKDALSEAVNLLEKTDLDPKQNAIFKKKSEDFANELDNMPVGKDMENQEEKDRLANKLISFEPSIEAPSASEALAIKYNEEWGRQIIATRSIEPGEILVRENSYFSFVDPSENWFFCSHCTKPSWNLIPCKGCVFNVYCSEQCRLEANQKYHKFECSILPYICEKDNERKILFCHLRFLLTAVYDAGGLEQLKQEQIAAQSFTDPRTKGFMEDGIFHSDKLRSCLSLMPKVENCGYLKQQIACEGVGFVVYHLATKTDFFGKKYDITPLKMMSEPYMLFFAALMFRQVLSYNSLKLKYYHPKGMARLMGISLYPFCSLFNNSCDSNTDLIYTNDNEIVVYAIQPIEKESQVFISYYERNILLVPKKKRQEDYRDFMKFTCKCTPCVENWSHICFPLLKDLLETAPDALSTIEERLKNVKNQMTQDNVYKKDLENEVTSIMKLIAEKATVICHEYRLLEKTLKRMLITAFGKRPLMFPDTC